jgi:hypothetical protein
MLAITAVTAAYSYVEQSSQARSQRRAVNEAAESNRRANALQAEQLNKQAADEMSQRAREALIERGRLRVIASESGIGGLGNETLERQSRFNEGFDIASIESNRAAGVRQLQEAGRSNEAQTNMRLASVRSPSLVGTGLQIAGAGADYMKAQEKKK